MDTDTVTAEADSGLLGVISDVMSIFPISDYTSNATLSLATDAGALATLQTYLNTIGISVLTNYQTIQVPEDPKTFAPLLTAADNSAVATALESLTPAQLVKALLKVLPSGTDESTATQLVQSMAVLLTQIAAASEGLAKLDAVSYSPVSQYTCANC